MGNDEAAWKYIILVYGCYPSKLSSMSAIDRQMKNLTKAYKSEWLNPENLIYIIIKSHY